MRRAGYAWATWLAGTLAAMEGANEGDVVALFQLVAALALELPVGVVDEHEDARADRVAGGLGEELGALDDEVGADPMDQEAHGGARGRRRRGDLDGGGRSGRRRHDGGERAAGRPQGGRRRAAWELDCVSLGLRRRGQQLEATASGGDREGQLRGRMEGSMHACTRACACVGHAPELDGQCEGIVRHAGGSFGRRARRRQRWRGLCLEVWV